MNKNIKYLVEKLFDDNDDLLNNDELTLDELNIAENISEYVNLGLPSGTLWCKHNVGAKTSGDDGTYLTYDDASKNYILPTYDLFIELEKECEWTWLPWSNGYVVTGKNNNIIFLPAAGYKSNNKINRNNENGFYCASDASQLLVFILYFDHKDFYMGARSRLNKQLYSIRTVKNK